jgi:NAD(P)-dependent dehydrogenase (short-subunit alcohol dehydrogenase family)
VNGAELDGKVALVTGGAKGIGAAVARYLGGGAALMVVIADVDDAAGTVLAGDLDGLYVHCDVSDPAADEAAVAAAVARYGGLDVVHLNAGVATGCGVGDDFDLAACRRATGVNLDGVVFGAPAAIGALRARGGGTIVATASMAGITPVSWDPIYVANQHEVVGFVRSLGEALIGHSLAVHALCPSVTETALIAALRPLLEGGDFPILDVTEVVDACRFRHAPGPRD